jgi:ribosomal protein S18 acetylase RimI-like enzyme
MQGVVEEARSNGIEQLELLVGAEDHRAIAFYERLEFDCAATILMSCESTGNRATTIFIAWIPVTDDRQPTPSAYQDGIY